MAQNHQNGTTWHCFIQWSIWHDNEVQLRTIAGLEEQFNKLPDNGKTTTAITRQTESLVGPVLVRCEDDLDEKTVLAKIGMPSVHLLLSVNDILNKVVEICFEGNRYELLDLLGTQVGVLPHSYQGRERAYAGTFFGNKEFKFFPLTQNLKKIFIYALFSAIL